MSASLSRSAAATTRAHTWILTSADPLGLCQAMVGHLQVLPEMFGPFQDLLRVVPPVLSQFCVNSLFFCLLLLENVNCNFLKLHRSSVKC